MDLKQFHVLNQIISKQHRKVKRDLKILEIKRNINNKMQSVVDEVLNTFHDIKTRFIYNDNNLVYAKKR